MLHVIIDASPAEPVHRLSIVNHGSPPDATAPDERVYYWSDSVTGRKGELRHRRRDGAAALVAAVLLDV